MPLCGNEGNDKGCCCCIDSSYGVTFFGLCYILAFIGWVSEFFLTKDRYNRDDDSVIWVNRRDGYAYQWQYMSEG